MTVIEFSILFGVSRQSVYYWEKDQHEAPYAVTWAIYKELRDKSLSKGKTA